MYPVVCYLFPPVYLLFHLLYSLSLIVSFLDFLSLLKVLLELIHSSLKSGQHLYSHCYKLFYQEDWLTVFHLVFFSGIFSYSVAWSIFHCLFILLDFLCLIL